MLARLFVGPFVIVYWGLGLWGFILVVQYIHSQLGYLGVVLSVFILPIAYTLVPLWAGFADSYWLPAIVAYSPMALMIVVSLIGTAFESLKRG